MSCVYRFCCLDRIAYTSGLLLQMSHVPWSCLSVNSSVCWTHRWTVQTWLNRSPLSLKATFTLPQGDPRGGHRSRLNSHRLTTQTASSRCVWRAVWIALVGVYAKYRYVMYNVEFEQYSCRPVMDVQWLGHDPVILRLLNASLNTCLRDRIPPLWTPSV